MQDSWVNKKLVFTIVFSVVVAAAAIISQVVLLAVFTSYDSPQRTENISRPATVLASVDRCSNNPLESIQDTPAGCIVVSTNLTSYDAGRCSNVLCSANNSQCQNGQRCCCQVFTESSLLLQCSSGFMLVPIVASCGCQACSVPVTFALTVQDSTGLPISMAQVAIDGLTETQLTDVNGQIQFTVSSSQATVDVTITAMNFMMAMRTYSVRPGETNAPVVILTEISVTVTESVSTDQAIQVTSSAISVVDANVTDTTVANPVTASDSGEVGVTLLVSDLLNNTNASAMLTVESTQANISDDASLTLVTNVDLTVSDNATNESVPLSVLGAGMIGIMTDDGNAFESSDVELSAVIDEESFNSSTEYAVFQPDDTTGELMQVPGTFNMSSIAVTRRKRQGGFLRLVFRVLLRLSRLFVIGFVPRPTQTCYVGVLALRDVGGIDEVVPDVIVQLLQRPTPRTITNSLLVPPACNLILCTGTLTLTAERDGQLLDPERRVISVPSASINDGGVFQSPNAINALEMCQTELNAANPNVFIFREEPLVVVTTPSPDPPTLPPVFCAARVNVTSCMHLDVCVNRLVAGETLPITTLARADSTITAFQSGFLCDDVRSACIEIPCDQQVTVTAEYKRGGAMDDGNGCNVEAFNVTTSSVLGGSEVTFTVPSSESQFSTFVSSTSVADALATCNMSPNVAVSFNCIDRS